MVDYPQNDFTRMIEEVAGRNVSGARGAGLASASPLPTVRSADLGREVPTLPPLTPEEKAELDLAAAAAGVIDPRLGNVGEPDAPGGYKSLEEAIAAGTPVADPAADIKEGKIDMAGLYKRPGRVIGVNGYQPPRLPDFRKAQYIDLEQGVVFLDNMAFPIGPDSIAEFKQFVVTTAHAAIMEKLNEAMNLLSPPTEVEGSSAETEGGSEPLS